MQIERMVLLVAELNKTKSFYQKYFRAQVAQEFYDDEALIRFKAGGNLGMDYEKGGEIYKKLLKFASDKWNPSLFMPKEAARIFLKVKDVHVERLQDITEEQALKEGAINNIGFIHSPDNEYDQIHTAREDFIQIWNATIKQTDFDLYGWDANPWVWVIEVERIEIKDE